MHGCVDTWFNGVDGGDDTDVDLIDCVNNNGVDGGVSTLGAMELTAVMIRMLT